MAVEGIVPQRPMVWHALRYASIGIPVFPCKADKAPLTEHGFKDATTDAETIRAWWKRWPKALIGMPGGAISGYVVLDIDPRNGGDFDELIARYPDLPHTRQAATPSGGIHLWYKAPPGVPLPKDNSGKIGPGVDFIGDGAYVVVPPSVRPDGEYVWTDERECAELPASIIAAVQRPKPQPVTSATPARKRKPSDSQPATGNAADYWLAWALEQARDGTSDRVGFLLAQQLLLSRGNPDIDGTLRAYAAQASYDVHKPFTDRDVSRWLTSAQASDLVRRGEPARGKAQTAQPQPPISLVERRGDYGADYSSGDDEPPPEADEPTSARKRYNRTEMGNSERLMDAYGDRMRYAHAFGWCAWDGRRWRRDGELAIRRWAKLVIRNIYKEAADLAAEAANAEEGERETLAEESKTLMAWALKSETDRMVTSMLNLAKSACEADPAQFDAAPLLLNCLNGTLDLKTGELHAHRQADYLMQLAPVAYDVAAKAPTFTRFVNDILCGNPALIGYMQRALGYSLTGDVGEQVWHLLVGDGENGKGTLMECISEIMGDYAGILSPEAITLSGNTRDSNAPSPEIAELKGKRFIKITETEEGARIAPARIKMLSGGDELQGRHLRRDLLRFKPTFKMWIYTNHKPEARETTHAFWRRVRYVPFDFSLKDAPEKKDTDLPAKLRAEASGILAWLVRGCLDWQAGGLQPPPEVLDATDTYQRDSDYLRLFLEECTTPILGASVSAKAVYDAYKNWCKENGERELPQRRLGKMLAERGFERHHMRDGWWWIGLSLDREGV